MQKPEKIRGRKVQVWIFRRAPRLEVLILKMKSANGGYWQPVTGGVEEGEDFPQAALREAQEETGLAFALPLTDLHHEFSFQSRAQLGGALVRERAFAIEATFESSAQIKLSGEHENFEWTTPEQAEKKNIL